MTTVKSLCKTGVILENGRLKETGLIEPIVAHYLKGDSNIENYKCWEKPAIAKDGFELLEIGVRKKGGDYRDIMRVDNELELKVRYKLARHFPQLHLTFHVKNESGERFFSTSGVGCCIDFDHPIGEHEQVCHIPANFFNWGSFAVDLFVIINRKEALGVENDLVTFDLSNKEQALGTWMGREPGDITPKFDYSERKI